MHVLYSLQIKINPFWGKKTDDFNFPGCSVMIFFWNSPLCTGWAFLLFGRSTIHVYMHMNRNCTLR